MGIKWFCIREVKRILPKKRRPQGYRMAGGRNEWRGGQIIGEGGGLSL